ncbi:MAG: thermonuclease family protein [Fimbriimonadaceae bacterium]|nr:thermonuclease family protein [Alphaproteobacteria bacterium]
MKRYVIPEITSKSSGVIFAAMVYLSFAAAVPAYPASVSSGLGEAVDGQTVILNGQRFELAGIVAPKPGFQCTIRGAARDCGAIARAALLDLMAGAQITCEVVAGGRYRCTANGYDLSEGMVYVGWAVPLDNAPARYRHELKRAQDRKHGLWRASPPLTIQSIMDAGQ